MGWAPRFRLRWEGQRTRESGCLSGGWPIPNLGDAARPAPAKPALSGREEFFGRRSRSKNGFEFILPAAAGGSLRRLPSRARGVGRRRWGALRGKTWRVAPLDGALRKSATLALPGESMGRSVFGSPMGQILKGYSVGWSAAGRLRRVPYRASLLDRKDQQKSATLFGSVVGMVFLQRAHVFVLGKNFLKLPHIWRGSFVIQGERGRSHHGLGGPI